MSVISFERSVGKIIVLLLLLAAVIPASSQTINLNFNFRYGALGWTADYSGYPPATNNNGIYQLDKGVRYAPRKLTRVPLRAFYIQGNNFSGGLVMFLKRRLTSADGIVAGRSYRLDYVLKIASNAPDNCVGPGAPPGEGVLLRVGGNSTEPTPRLDATGWLELNMDLLTGTGPAGNIANGFDCEIMYPIVPFVYINRQGQQPIVTAGETGELWLFVGTVSLFEGKTALYYQEIGVTLVPIS